MFWIVLWFVVGLISALCLCVKDMRGQPFDENYFSNGVWFAFVLMVCCGYMSLIIVFSMFMSEKKWFTKLVYRIANIGMMKE